MTATEEAFRQTLPDLSRYRAEFVSNGVTLPLPLVPWKANGLLAELPAPPANRSGWPWNVESPSVVTPIAGAPKLTIVMPSYNQGAFLEEALRSVLLQNYPCLEFIVIDGGSSDESTAVIERYRPWLSFARSARDHGQSHAINLGFSLGNGAINGWLNSDDLYLPSAFARVAAAFQAGGEFIPGESLALDEASGRRRFVPPNLVRARYRKFPALVPSHATFWASARHQPIWEEQTCALDYELWIRLLPGLRVKPIAWPLGVIRDHDAAKSHDAKFQQRWSEDAHRNGLAHPELYREGLRSRILAKEFRVVQRLYRNWRSRNQPERLEQLRRECGWSQTPAIE